VLGPLDNVRREVLACAACRGSLMVDGATVDRRTVCVVDSCWYNITTVYLSESVHNYLATATRIDEVKGSDWLSQSM
jgi:hypothetical protein